MAKKTMGDLASKVTGHPLLSPDRKILLKRLYCYFPLGCKFSVRAHNRACCHVARKLYRQTTVHTKKYLRKQCRETAVGCINLLCWTVAQNTMPERHPNDITECLSTNPDEGRQPTLKNKGGWSENKIWDFNKSTG